MKKIPDNSILKKEITIPFFNMKTMRKIFKKNKKKSSIHKRKRKTFRGLFAKNVLIGLFLTVIFAVGLFNIGREYIFSEIKSQSSFLSSNIQQIISKSENDNTYYSQELESQIRLHSSFHMVLDNKGKYQMSSGNPENGSVFVRITDEDRNITYSNRRQLMVAIDFEEDDKMFMKCDTENKDIPELQQFEEDYMTLSKKVNYDTGKNYDIIIKPAMQSAYVNKEENVFIPHEIDINLIKYYPENGEPREILESKSYNINVPEKDGYKLIEFDLSNVDHIERVANDTYPRYFSLGYYGTDKKWFDDTDKEYSPASDLLGGWSNVGNTTRRYFQNTKVYIDGRPHTLTVVLQVNVWNSVTKPLYFRIVTIFLLAILTIAFLDAWRKNVRNQADYMFEDYQKNLTNSLAHDLKTPLMAIGGYAENILSGNLSDEETSKYLSSIMDNVSYTDSIITRTLELSTINSINIKHEQVNIYNLIEDAIEKYSLILDEKDITVKIDGKAEVSADCDMLKTIIENLISNAVKYTTENGNVNISISEKSVCIKNTVNKKVDIKNLKKPFIKGDTARSNQSGSGLGLAIAENASIINGFKLILTCSDNEFTAELKF